MHLIDLTELPPKIEEFLKREAEVAAIARRYKDAQDFLYWAAASPTPSPRRGAEAEGDLPTIHAEGYAAGEMKHGPIALIDERMPVLVLCAKGESYEKTLSNLEEAHARGGRVIAVGTAGDDLLKGKSEDVISLPPADGTRGRSSRWCRSSCSRTTCGAQGHRRRPAAQPRQVGDGGVARSFLPPGSGGELELPRAIRPPCPRGRPAWGTARRRAARSCPSSP